MLRNASLVYKIYLFRLRSLQRTASVEHIKQRTKKANVYKVL